MLKRHLITFLIGMLGGTLGAFGVARLDHAAVPAPTDQPSTRVSPASTPPQDAWQQAVSDAALSTVAVQTFKDDRVLRFGSGSILSSDGLLVTTADTVPYVSGSAVYQVAYEDRILRGQVVLRDWRANLALVKVDASNLNVAGLAAGANIQSGKDLMVSGKMVSFSKPGVFSQRAVLAYLAGTEVILDTSANNFLSGARAITIDGEGLGIVFLRNGRVQLIGSDTINDFLQKYLASVKEPGPKR